MIIFISYAHVFTGYEKDGHLSLSRMYKQIQSRAFDEFNNWYDVLKFNINSVFRRDPAGYELVARTRWMLLKSSIHRLSLVTYHEMVSFCPKSKRSNTFFMGIIWQTEKNIEDKKVQVLSLIDITLDGLRYSVLSFRFLTHAIVIRYFCCHFVFTPTQFNTTSRKLRCMKLANWFLYM